MQRHSRLIPHLRAVVEETCDRSERTDVYCKVGVLVHTGETSCLRPQNSSPLWHCPPASGSSHHHGNMLSQVGTAMLAYSMLDCCL